jgi:hypothetical protein
MSGSIQKRVLNKCEHGNRCLKFSYEFLFFIDEILQSKKRSSTMQNWRLEVQQIREVDFDLTEGKFKRNILTRVNIVN